MSPSLTPDSKMRRGRAVVAAALAGMLLAAVVTPLPGSTQELGTNNVADGDTFEVIPQEVTGTFVYACINDYCPSPNGDPGYIGAFEVTDGAGNNYLSWCSEAGAAIEANVAHTYNDVVLDGRLQYLTWHYDQDLLDAGNTPAYEFAAVQALVWAIRSDALFDPDVFDGISLGDLDNITPSAYVNGGTGRIGFNTNNASYTAVMDDATQAIYDLFVEATAKAGPWTLDGSDPAGVTLSGANGTIENESITFDVGGPVTTDSNGFAAWPEGASTASIEAPGDSFETTAGNAQNVLLATQGTTLSANRTATTTTTVAPTTTTTVVPTTTTTVAPITTTTVAPTTTTIIVAPPELEMPEPSEPADPIAAPPDFTG